MKKILIPVLSAVVLAAVGSVLLISKFKIKKTAPSEISE